MRRSGRPWALARLHETFTEHMPLAAGDLNDDGLVDLVASGAAELFAARTGADGCAAVQVTLDRLPFTEGVYSASWDGVVTQAQGEAVFSVSSTCPSRADLTGDCAVDLADLGVFGAQWLSQSAEQPCPYTADLAGADCRVDLADFAAFAEEWLTSF